MESQEHYRRLYDYFKTFPGIGKRQAERFVYYILTREGNWVAGFLKEIENSRKNVRECAECFRIFRNTNSSEKLCERCRSQWLDESMLAVVEKNIDAENFIEKTNFLGRVFVLGGVIPVIEKKNRSPIRLEALLSLVKKKLSQPEPLLREVILCTSLTSDGEFTASFMKQKLKELVNELCRSNGNKHTSLKITTLGRGFSTGTELEYADKETLLHALQNRSENII